MELRAKQSLLAPAQPMSQRKSGFSERNASDVSVANNRTCNLDCQLAPEAATPGQLAQTRERHLTLRFSFREPARG